MTSRYELPLDLEMQWFYDAVATYELEIGPTGYDNTTDEFPDGFSQHKIKTIGLIMKRFYCERELSKVNKIQSIVGKDISLTGSGDQKRMTYEELVFERDSINDLINKQKENCYI